MKKYTVKNYKGNLVESLEKFKKSHEKMRIVEAVEGEDFLTIVADDYLSTPLFDFGSKLLMFGVEVHLWHLNCDNGDTHAALKELYEACDDIGDRLLEALIGIYGGTVTIHAASTETEVGRYDRACIDKISAMKEEAAGLAPGSPAGISSILDDFCETCNSVIYKLKQLN